MNSNIRILIKIYYICSIFYFIRQIISRINSIESRFILIIRLYFKVCSSMWRNQNFLMKISWIHNQFLIVPSLALITPLSNNFLSIGHQAKKPIKFPKASSFIVSLTPFNRIPESSRDLTIFKMSFNSSFEIIKVVLLAPDPTFLCIKASVKL